MTDLYKELETLLDQIAFDDLWPGFKPFPFALYDEKNVYLKDRVIPRTNAFYGNTAIVFEGEYLAIWYVQAKTLSMPKAKLAALMVHEMFHAFQHTKKEPRFGNEFKGLAYPYDLLNLSAKYQENCCLAETLVSKNHEKWVEFQVIRNQRLREYPAALEYEMGTETIEGMAKYIEMKALKLLDYEVYLTEIQAIYDTLMNRETLMPIRMISYYCGAAMMLIAEAFAVSFSHEIGVEKKRVSELLVLETPMQNRVIPVHPEIEKRLKSFLKDRRDKVERVIDQATTTIDGAFTIVGFDPLNAFIDRDYLYCAYFLAYQNKDETIYLQCEVVAKMSKDYTLTKLYYS